MLTKCQRHAENYLCWSIKLKKGQVLTLEIGIRPYMCVLFISLRILVLVSLMHSHSYDIYLKCPKC